MIKRIDLFMPPLSQYGVLHYFTKEIYEALQRINIQCRVLVAQKNNPAPFLDSIFASPPDCTFSLNGLLPDNDGNFFCNMIKIPHVACLVDSPNFFLALTQSHLNIITCPDRFSCQYFRDLGFDNVIFLPHGVGKDLSPDPTLEKKHDVVMLSTCIDYLAIQEHWYKTYPKQLCKILEEAAERTLTDHYTPYPTAFAESLNNQLGQPNAIDPSKINLLKILDELEMFIRGKDRIELVKNIKDARVDIFGSSGWEKYFDETTPNIKVHFPVPYEEALHIMKQSKIVLNSCPWIKDGAHERIFAGISCGAAVITNKNVYMADKFIEGKEILFYEHNRWDDLNQTIQDILSNEQKRVSLVEKGRNKVAAEHTWDKRMELFLKELDPILERIKAVQGKV